MGLIRACVDSFIWDADSKFPVTVFLEVPTVAVSLAIPIWFGFSVLIFHVGIGKQRIYAVIMESNWEEGITDFPLWFLLWKGKA